MIVDSHVHLFPPRVFDAIWRWFDTYAWNIKYRLKSEAILSFLAGQGVGRVVGLCYSHQPEMARPLNRFMAELARANPMLIACGTVLPGGERVMVGLNGVIFVVDAAGAVRSLQAPAGTPLSAAIPHNGGLLAVGESGVQQLATLK